VGDNADDATTVPDGGESMGPETKTIISTFLPSYSGRIHGYADTTTVATCVSVVVLIGLGLCIWKVGLPLMRCGKNLKEDAKWAKQRKREFDERHQGHGK
jgi:hypothetical protein